MPEIVSFTDLTKAVDSLRSDSQPIVTSKAVKDFFKSQDKEWDDNGWSGRHLDNADDAACERRLLQKWKSGPHKNSMVGWSPSASVNPTAFAAAEKWALGTHWHKL